MHWLKLYSLWGRLSQSLVLQLSSKRAFNYMQLINCITQYLSHTPQPWKITPLFRTCNPYWPNNHLAVTILDISVFHDGWQHPHTPEKNFIFFLYIHPRVYMGWVVGGSPGSALLRKELSSVVIAVLGNIIYTFSPLYGKLYFYQNDENISVTQTRPGNCWGFWCFCRWISFPVLYFA